MFFWPQWLEVETGSDLVDLPGAPGLRRGRGRTWLLFLKRVVGVAAWLGTDFLGRNSRGLDPSRFFGRRSHWCGGLHWTETLNFPGFDLLQDEPFLLPLSQTLPPL